MLCAWARRNSGQLGPIRRGAGPRPELRNTVAIVVAETLIPSFSISPSIRGELLKLGIVVSKRSIRRYRWRKPTSGGSQTWRTFLSNQLKGIWAADLLVVHTINYRVLYVLFFIRHDLRELIHFNVTSSPTAAWVWRQLIGATPWGRQPKYLIHDRDAVYGRTFGARLAGHRQRSNTGPGATGERHRRTRRALNTHGVSGPHDRHQRATPPCSARRVRQLLQP
jgi:hypothetical protein